MAKNTTEKRTPFPRTFRYCGAGAGIPGLPHELTEDEARALGVRDVLDAALANGSYQEIGAAQPAQEEQP